MLAAVATGGLALAAPDAPRSKDHPLLTRYPNSHIAEYEKNYNALEFAVGQQGGEPQRKPVEGDATVIRYFHDDAQKQPSPLQLIRNYQNAVKAIGGKEVWVRVEPEIFSAPAQSYRLAIVEVAALKQVVSANKLLDELNRNGFVALYISFDTGKWDLKADGQATVREIVAALKSAPTLKVAIEGHTDNVGQAAANKALSEKRAQSVMAAIVAGGIDARRLSAAGFGQERPVADNRGEEDRARNRRVELVRK